MGKVRTRFIGIEEVEKKEKKEQKERAQEKKLDKKKPDAKVVEQKKEKKQEKVKEPIKLANKEEVDKTKKKIKTAPSSKKRGKNYLVAKKDTSKIGVTLLEAIKLIKKIKYAKFDESIELHIKILKEGQKGEVKMPHSIGKELKVGIVDDKLLIELEKGKIDLDVLITHPSFMPKIVKFAKILGPKGLMPNPKSGTISEKPEEVAKKFKSGVLKWKSELKQPLIHQQVAKLSLEDKKIEENIKAFLESVGKSNIQEVFIASTMSPSIRLDIIKI
ncbi:MAG: hypothetical protein ABH812_01410 [bacterium]